MVALLLLLAAQAAQPSTTPAPDAAPVATPPATRRICRQDPGSEQIVCRTVPQQQLGYHLPQYGPAARATQSGKAVSVKFREQMSNRGRARNRSMATVGIPF